MLFLILVLLPTTQYASFAFIDETKPIGSSWFGHPKRSRGLFTKMAPWKRHNYSQNSVVKPFSAVVTSVRGGGESKNDSEGDEESKNEIERDPQKEFQSDRKEGVDPILTNVTNSTDHQVSAEGVDNDGSGPFSVGDENFPSIEEDAKIDEILKFFRLEDYAKTDEKSLRIREIMLERTVLYLSETLQLNGFSSSPQHPRRLLHFIASKVPAIKRSPDSLLRIRSASADVDAGVAAYAIGLVAAATETYERIWGSDDETNSKGGDKNFASTEIVNDRRFEQLVECVLCGVDVKKRMVEARDLEHETNDDDSISQIEDFSSGDLDEIEDEDEEIVVNEGVSISDASCAAWGMAVLGADELRFLGGRKPFNILTALSLRSRELVMARLQSLQRGPKDDGSDAPTDSKRRSIFEGEIADLVEDVVSAMWSFACVKGCVGLNSYHLFDTCCSLLVENTERLWIKRQKTAEVDDIVDRLAKAQEVVSQTQKIGSVEKDTLIDEDTHDLMKHAKMVDAAEKNVTSSLPVNSVLDEHKAREGNGTGTIGSAQTLLNQLPPDAIANALWALATHGVRRYSSSNKTKSSTEFVEVALDRLMSILKNDFIGESAAVNDSQMKSTIEPHKERNRISSEVKSSAIIESDAANRSAGLENEGEFVQGDSEENHSTPKTTEEITEKHQSFETLTDPQNVTLKVIDAATILAEQHSRTDSQRKPAAEGRDSLEEEGTDDRTITQKQFESSTGTELVRTSGTGDNEQQATTQTFETKSESEQESPENGLNRNMTRVFCFSPRDVITIAWAATELRASRWKEFVELMSSLFVLTGSDVLDGIGSGDLANLAWSIAKSYETRGNHTNISALIEPSSLFLITRWISKNALEKLGETTREETEEGFCFSRNIAAPQAFEAPELSRMMWSLAFLESFIRASSFQNLERDRSLQELTYAVVNRAASDMSKFSAEDLARIGWAFTEICDPQQDYPAQTQLAILLGNMLAIIESSLLRWEGGQYSLSSRSPKSRIKENVRFTPLFGRSRLSLPIIDMLIGGEDIEDDEEDDQDILQSKEFSISSQRVTPLLRDLTVDPATLCKAAYGFTNYSARHKNMRSAGTLVRVATRLFASKQGRLLKECSSGDFVRLCGACANIMRALPIDFSSEDRNFITNHFLRRVAQLLNGSEKKEISARKILNDLNPLELATLLWSLGELGFKLRRKDDRYLESKRLSILIEVPDIPKDDLRHLSASKVTDLACGLIMLGNIPRCIKLLSSTLSVLEEKIPLLSPDGYCRLGRSLLQLKQSLSSITSSQNTTTDGTENLVEKESSNPKEPDASDKSESALGFRPDDQTTKANQAAETPTSKNSSTGSMEDLKRQCERLMEIAHSKAAEDINLFSSVELRIMLQTVTIGPIQADNFVKAAEDVVNKRIAALASKLSVSDGTGIHDLVRRTADLSVNASSMISSLVDVLEKTKSSDKEGLLSSLSEMNEVASRAASFACSTADRIDRAQTDVEARLQSDEEGAAFELGRCQELIASYHRFDFQTGRRRTRYDIVWRKDIGKRVLSKLFR